MSEPDARDSAEQKHERDQQRDPTERQKRRKRL